MTSTQEPDTVEPQSALCICSRKWKAKLIVSIHFGTKTSEFCLRIISIFIRLSFDSKDSKINFDIARSTTVIPLLGALRALYNISSDDGEELFADELLVYYEWKSRYKVEKEENENRKENSRTALDGKLRCLKPVYSCR